MAKKHGNIGNLHAQKYSSINPPATLVVRCSRADKNRWVKAAREEGKKVGVWVIDKLNTY